MIDDRIALFDMDGTLANYSEILHLDMAKLRGPMERESRLVPQARSGS